MVRARRRAEEWWDASSEDDDCSSVGTAPPLCEDDVTDELNIIGFSKVEHLNYGCTEVHFEPNTKTIAEYIENNLFRTDKGWLLVAPCGVGKSKFAPGLLAQKLGFNNIVMLTERIMSTQSSYDWYVKHPLEGVGEVSMRAGGKECSHKSEGSRNMRMMTTGAFNSSKDRLSEDTLIILDEAHNPTSDTLKVIRDVPVSQLLMTTASPLVTGLSNDFSTPYGKTIRFQDYVIPSEFETLMHDRTHSGLLIMATVNDVYSEASHYMKMGKRTVIATSEWKGSGEIVRGEEVFTPMSFAKIEEYVATEKTYVIATDVLQESVTLKISLVVDCGERVRPRRFLGEFYQNMKVVDDANVMLKVLKQQVRRPAHVSELIQSTGRVGRMSLSEPALAVVGNKDSITTGVSGLFSYDANRIKGGSVNKAKAESNYNKLRQLARKNPKVPLMVKMEEHYTFKGNELMTEAEFEDLVRELQPNLIFEAPEILSSDCELPIEDLSPKNVVMEVNGIKINMPRVVKTQPNQVLADSLDWEFNPISMITLPIVSDINVCLPGNVIWEENCQERTELAPEPTVVDKQIKNKFRGGSRKKHLRRGYCAMKLYSGPQRQELEFKPNMTLLELNELGVIPAYADEKRFVFKNAYKGHVEKSAHGITANKQLEFIPDTYWQQLHIGSNCEEWVDDIGMTHADFLQMLEVEKEAEIDESQPLGLGGDSDCWKEVIAPVGLNYNMRSIPDVARRQRSIELANARPLDLNEFAERCWDPDRLLPVSKVHKTKINERMPLRQAMWQVRIEQISPVMLHLAEAALNQPEKPGFVRLDHLVLAIKENRVRRFLHLRSDSACDLPLEIGKNDQAHDADNALDEGIDSMNVGMTKEAIENKIGNMVIDEIERMKTICPWHVDKDVRQYAKIAGIPFSSKNPVEHTHPVHAALRRKKYVEVYPKLIDADVTIYQIKQHHADMINTEFNITVVNSLLDANDLGRWTVDTISSNVFKHDRCKTSLAIFDEWGHYCTPASVAKFMANSQVSTLILSHETPALAMFTKVSPVPSLWQHRVDGNVLAVEVEKEGRLYYQPADWTMLMCRKIVSAEYDMILHCGIVWQSLNSYVQVVTKYRVEVPSHIRIETYGYMRLPRVFRDQYDTDMIPRDVFLALQNYANAMPSLQPRELHAKVRQLVDSRYHFVSPHTAKVMVAIIVVLARHDVYADSVDKFYDSVMGKVYYNVPGRMKKWWASKTTKKWHRRWIDMSSMEHPLLTIPTIVAHVRTMPPLYKSLVGNKITEITDLNLRPNQDVFGTFWEFDKEDAHEFVDLVLSWHRKIFNKIKKPEDSLMKTAHEHGGFFFDEQRFPTMNKTAEGHVTLIKQAERWKSEHNISPNLKIEEAIVSVTPTDTNTLNDFNYNQKADVGKDDSKKVKPVIFNSDSETLFTSSSSDNSTDMTDSETTSDEGLNQRVESNTESSDSESVMSERAAQDRRASKRREVSPDSRASKRTDLETLMHESTTTGVIDPMSDDEQRTFPDENDALPKVFLKTKPSLEIPKVKIPKRDVVQQLVDQQIHRPQMIPSEDTGSVASTDSSVNFNRKHFTSIANNAKVTFDRVSRGLTNKLWWDDQFPATIQRRYSNNPYWPVQPGAYTYPKEDCMLEVLSKVLTKSRGVKISKLLVWGAACSIMPRNEIATYDTKMSSKFLDGLCVYYSLNIKVISSVNKPYCVGVDFGEQYKLSVDKGHWHAEDFIRPLTVRKHMTMGGYNSKLKEELFQKLTNMPQIKWVKYTIEVGRAEQYIREAIAGNIGTTNKNPKNADELKRIENQVMSNRKPVEITLCIVEGDPGCGKSKPPLDLLKNKRYHRDDLFQWITPNSELKKDAAEKLGVRANKPGEKGTPRQYCCTYEVAMWETTGCAITFMDEYPKFQPGYLEFMALYKPWCKIFVLLGDRNQGAWSQVRPQTLLTSLPTNAEVYSPMSNQFIVGSSRFGSDIGNIFCTPVCREFKHGGIYFTDVPITSWVQLKNFWPDASDRELKAYWDDSKTLEATTAAVDAAELMNEMDNVTMSASQGLTKSLIRLVVSKTALSKVDYSVLWNAVTRTPRLIIYFEYAPVNDALHYEIISPVWRELVWYKRNTPKFKKAIYDKDHTVNFRKIQNKMSHDTKLYLAFPFEKCLNWKHVGRHFHRLDGCFDPFAKADSGGSMFYKQLDPYDDGHSRDPEMIAFKTGLKVEVPSKGPIVMEPEERVLKLRTLVPRADKAIHIENFVSKQTSRWTRELHDNRHGWSQQFPDELLYRLDVDAILKKRLTADGVRVTKRNKEALRRALNKLNVTDNPLLVDPYILNRALRQTSNDPTSFRAGVKQRVRKGSYKDNVNELKRGEKYADILFANWKRFMQMPDSTPWDPKLWEESIAIFEERRQNRPTKMKQQSSNRSEPTFHHIVAKTQIKLKSREPNKGAKPLQIIEVFNNKYVYEHGPEGVYILKKLTEMAPPGVFMLAGKTFDDLYKHNAQYDTGVNWMSDLTAQEKDMRGWYFLFFGKIMKMLGFSDERVANMIEDHMRIPIGNQTILFQTLSGMIFTWLLNTTGNQARIATFYDVRPGEPSQWTGDDSKFFRKLIRLKEADKWLTIETAEETIVEGNTGEFAMYLTRKGKTFKDPIILLDKLLVKIAQGKAADVIHGYFYEWLSIYHLGDMIYDLMDEEEIESSKVLTTIMMNLRREYNLGQKLNWNHITPKDYTYNFNAGVTGSATGLEFSLETKDILIEDHEVVDEDQ